MAAGTVQTMDLRTITIEVACVAMLQIIISGIAWIGGRTCSRIAPAAAENAKPENPETRPPRKTARERVT